MASTFMGLSTALRGLYASQTGISVTGNNLSNADTPGYSRQTINQTAIGPVTTTSGGAIIGGGPEVKSVERVRDPNLDQKFWRVNGSQGEWDIKADSLKEMEELLGDTDTGLASVLEDFYTAMQDLSDDTGDGTARTTLLENASSVCSYLNDNAGRLQALKEDINTSIKTTVDEINAYAKQIADFNERIGQASITGTGNNELEDARDLLIDKLSKLVDIKVTKTQIGNGLSGQKNSILSISIDGFTLVNDGEVQQLECYENADNLYGIRWQDSGADFHASSGELKGYLDLRDGDGSGSGYNGIPYYQKQLDDFARNFAQAFNEGVGEDGNTYYPGHVGGYGADGSTGIRFFTFDGNSSGDFMSSGADMAARYANINASNISVSSDIQKDVSKIAASSKAGEAENNENINKLISWCADRRMFNKGTPVEFINSLISTIGTDSAYAQRLTDNKSSIVKNIEDRRSSVSGVSTNEDTAYLIKYQKSYDASAKMVTVWNQIYETTINMVK